MIAGQSENFENEHRLRHKDGHYIWVSSQVSSRKEENGKIHRIAGSVSDITARKESEQNLLRSSLYNELTHLPNRALFLDRVNRAIALSIRDKNYLFAVMALNIDHFKGINDSLGRSVGDELLIEVSKNLKECLRPEDTAAHLGGDEFAILLEDIKHIGGANLVANKIHKLFASPFDLSGQKVFVTMSIGIALSATGYDRAEDLLRDAEIAMHRAKATGKGKQEVFDQEMYSRSLSLLQLESDLRRALERDELTAFYQPILSLETGKITGTEALMRWNHPSRGLVSPGEFIPVLEQTGLIVNAGEMILKMACQHNKKLHDAGYPKLRIAVNFSSIQFQFGQLPELIKRTLEESQMSPNSLTVEITESIAMENIDLTVSTLNKLSNLGVQVSIDDFGTGYSSLSYLKKFPINNVKIDASFVREMTSDSDDAAITSAIIAMAHQLKLKVIAEGVETEEQLEYLRTHECDSIQGYWFSRPIPHHEIFDSFEGKWRLLV
jgi:diguanylate cyclase (GGDEF)-like protein